MIFRPTIRHKLFLSHVLIVFVVAGSIGIYFYSSAVNTLSQSVQERLKFTAALVSWTLDAQAIHHIRSEADVTDPVYIEVLGHLRALRRTNPDIAFLYVMRREGDRISFVVDSDETEAQALPGRVYTQELPNLSQGFLGVTADDEAYEDDWGVFLSGYAPIKNSIGEYLVGVDMRADAVQDKYRGLRISALCSLVASIVLAFIFARHLTSRFTVPINMAIKGCTDIASGKLGPYDFPRTNDELDELLEAVNSIGSALAASEAVKQEAFESLKQSRDELEIRVEQRTADLKEVNDKLSHEMAKRLVAQEALHEAATTDPLTRLYNRRAMIERLDHELSRNKRSHAPFAVLLADLDNFKSVNDAMGHPAGDAILEETALRMRSMLRSQDTAARWGGEEFIILLPETTAGQAYVVAEKLRCRIADFPFFSGGESLHVTVSFGVVEVNGVADAVSLIAAVDKALYEAKKKGRNRVEVVEA